MAAVRMWPSASIVIIFRTASIENGTKVLPLSMFDDTGRGRFRGIISHASLGRYVEDGRIRAQVDQILEACVQSRTRALFNKFRYTPRQRTNNHAHDE
jgi:hypothetical protein